MTTKFLRALSKLKPPAPGQARVEQTETGPRGAVAYQSDVYRKKRPAVPVDDTKTRVAEH